MKRIKIISNPSAGKISNKRVLENLTRLLLDKGYILQKYETGKKKDAYYEAFKTKKEDWDIILVYGGDGTLNEVAAGVTESKSMIPLAIYPAGTVNDFANQMEIPDDLESFFKMIEDFNVKTVDIGKVKDDYFINVAACGAFVDVPHVVSVESKAVLGHLAYYLEGLKHIPRGKKDSLTVNFESKEYNKEEDILLFLVTNSSSVGGFRNMVPDADPTDSYLNVLILKSANIKELTEVFFALLKGEHINHPDIEYFKTKELYVSSEEKIIIDVDGELAGELPAKFQIINNALNVLVKK